MRAGPLIQPSARVSYLLRQDKVLLRALSRELSKHRSRLNLLWQMAERPSTTSTEAWSPTSFAPSTVIRPRQVPLAVSLSRAEKDTG
jgi:hypothetical protein